MPNFLGINPGAKLIDSGTPRGPETIRFSPAVGYVQMLVGSNAASGETVTITAYNAAGVQVDTASVVLSAALTPAVVEGPQISRVVVSSISTTAFVIDDLTFVQREPGMQWGSYLGDALEDFAHDIAADAAGNVVISGYTKSSGWVSGGWDTTYEGLEDGFLVKMDSNGQHLWSTYFGAGAWEEATGIGVDSNGNVLVTGGTQSAGWISGGWDTSYNGEGDAFVAKLSSSGAHLWSTYMGNSQAAGGGAGYERGLDIAADADGNVYATGFTCTKNCISGGWLMSSHG